MFHLRLNQLSEKIIVWGGAPELFASETHIGTHSTGIGAPEQRNPDFCQACEKQGLISDFCSGRMNRYISGIRGERVAVVEILRAGSE